ncbi:MAG: RAD55 family ATPase [Candidatus Heimdallarchaeaceae archaeon]
MPVKTRIDILTRSIESSLILLTGESGTSKKEIMYRFVEDGLNNEESILMVLLANSALETIEELRKRVENMDEHLEKGRINFIDVFSFRALPKEKTPNTLVVENANDLLKISVNLNERSKLCEKLRIVFDQFSLLMLYNEPIQVINFIQTVAARIRQRNQTALLVLDEGVIDEKIERTLQSISDMMVETRREEDMQMGPTQLVRVKFAKHEYEPRWVKIV